MRSSLISLAALKLLGFVPSPTLGFSTIHHSPKNNPNHLRKSTSTPTVVQSTPFDLDLYSPDDDNDRELDASSNPFQPNDDDDTSSQEQLLRSPLAAPPQTKLVLGINKYSHDTTLCAADASTGRVLFAMAKERLTRKKHDGGNVASLVELCLDQLELDLDSIVRVVMNNHHHRILPFIERDVNHMEWEEGLGINGGVEDGYSDEYNVLLSVEDKLEMSHHLAHAYSAAAQCPFDEGMVVVMDGMGETYRTMRRAVDEEDETYVSDLTLSRKSGVDIRFVPQDIDDKARSSYFDWREAESVYTFSKDGGRLEITPVFKRFSEENTPPTLYNHGFENMDSVGALYSRASSHIFGDWNACGKVMGLAPLQGHVWDQTTHANGKTKKRLTADTIEETILKGKLYKDDEEGLKIDRSVMMNMPFISRIDPDMFDDEGNLIRKKRYDFDDNDFREESISSEGQSDGSDEQPGSSKQLPTKVALDAISLASRMQIDLESVCIDFVKHFKSETGAANLCLAGGVALNSVLNGRLSRELGFENTFIPPYPGDDGIAVGCCAYALFGGNDYTDMPNLWNETLSPYLGPMPTDLSMKEAIEWASPWIEVETVRDDKERIDLMVEEIASGGVIALYNGRSELGPRALGHRSILADPRKKGLVRFINEFVKKRESFRPFAPSALAEYAGEWFDLGEHAEASGYNVSPYMSITAQVKESKRDLIPAVTHVDGSSRLQTVTPEAEPFYHRLISAFYKATGVPMVLNTSFNTLKSEPIVETPRNAIRSFLSSMGTIEMLFMGDYVIKRRPADIRKLLGEEQKSGLMTRPSFPRRTGSANYKTTFSASLGDSDDVDPVTLVQIPDRPMHNEKDGGWFELIDDLEGQLLGVCDGSVGVGDIMTQFAAMNEEENFEKISEQDQILLENILRRLVRLYEHTLISW
ncbi:hypothetical protein ACHAXS_009335 [Conticribra weissflogii]